MNTEDYIKIMKENMLPSFKYLRRTMPYYRNDPKHEDRLSEEANGISLDLNLIKNLWNVLKQKVENMITIQ